MRFIHTSDWHLTEGPRFAKTLECLHHIVDSGEDAGVDAWLVVGDLSGQPERHKQTPMERNAIVDIVARIAQTAPVIIPYGNHEYPTDLYHLSVIDGVYVIASPWAAEFEHAIFITQPYPEKRDLVGDFRGSVDESNARAGAVMMDIVAGLARKYEGDPRPLIYVGHHNIRGSKLAGGEVMSGKEVEVEGSSLDQLGFVYGAMGHIHAHQRVSEIAWYCGSPDRSNFGETDKKGFMLVEVENGIAKPTWHSTPCRQLATIHARWDGQGWVAPGGGELRVPDVSDCDVRVIASVVEDHAGTMDTAAFPLERFGSIVFDKRVTPRIAGREESAAIAVASTDEDRFIAYMNSLPLSVRLDEVNIQQCLDLVRELREEA